MSDLNRALSILFLLMYLSANTEVGQLLKLPVFVHHYYEHVENDKETSVLSFLKDHYNNQISHPDDADHDHKNLPFKTIGGHIALVPAIVPPSTVEISIQTACDFQDHTVFQIEDSYHYSAMKGVWQPPRNC